MWGVGVQRSFGREVVEPREEALDLPPAAVATQRSSVLRWQVTVGPTDVRSDHDDAALVEQPLVEHQSA